MRPLGKTFAFRPAGGGHSYPTNATTHSLALRRTSAPRHTPRGVEKEKDCATFARYHGHERAACRLVRLPCGRAALREHSWTLSLSAYAAFCAVRECLKPTFVGLVQSGGARGAVLPVSAPQARQCPHVHDVGEGPEFTARIARCRQVRYAAAVLLITRRSSSDRHIVPPH